jgi:hypothetical protein
MNEGNNKQLHSQEKGHHETLEIVNPVVHTNVAISVTGTHVPNNRGT